MSEALTASTVSFTGHGGDEIEAYLAVPDDGAAERGSVVVIHHMPGYDTSTKEIVRKFAAFGYAALMPTLYYREAPGASPQFGTGAYAINAQGTVGGAYGDHNNVIGISLPLLRRMLGDLDVTIPDLWAVRAR